MRNRNAVAAILGIGSVHAATGEVKIRPNFDLNFELAAAAYVL